MIGGFRFVLSVSRFEGSFLEIMIIIIEGSEERSVKAPFELQSSRVFEKGSKIRH